MKIYSDNFDYSIYFFSIRKSRLLMILPEKSIQLIRKTFKAVVRMLLFHNEICLYYTIKWTFGSQEHKGVYLSWCQYRVQLLVTT